MGVLSAGSRSISRPGGPPAGWFDAEPVVWRQLRRGLWVGRSGDRHIGIIEQGRHFTLTDANDQAHRGFASFEAACAATGPIHVLPPDGDDGALPDEPVRDPLRLGTTFLSAGAAASVVLALTIGTVQLASSLLSVR